MYVTASSQSACEHGCAIFFVFTMDYRQEVTWEHTKGHLYSLRLMIIIYYYILTISPGTATITEIVISLLASSRQYHHSYSFKKA